MYHSLVQWNDLLQAQETCIKHCIQDAISIWSILWHVIPASFHNFSQSWHGRGLLVCTEVETGFDPFKSGCFYLRWVQFTEGPHSGQNVIHQHAEGVPINLEYEKMGVNDFYFFL